MSDKDPKPWEPGFDIDRWLETHDLNSGDQMNLVCAVGFAKVTELHAAMLGRIRELEKEISGLRGLIRWTVEELEYGDDNGINDAEECPEKHAVKKIVEDK